MRSRRATTPTATPTSAIDFNDIETRRTYDLTRNLETSRTEAYGTPRARTITTQWHSTFRLPTQIDEPGKRTTFTHDANGNVLTKTVLDTTTSESRTWTYTYNSFGQVLTAERSAHRCLGCHDVHLLQLHDRLSVRPGEHGHERARPRHDLQHLQRARPAAHDHRSERRRDDADLRCTPAPDLAHGRQ